MSHGVHRSSATRSLSAFPNILALIEHHPDHAERPARCSPRGTEVSAIDLVNDGLQLAVGRLHQARCVATWWGGAPKLNICWRVSDTRTERSSSRAAMTARNTGYCGRRPGAESATDKRRDDTDLRRLFVTKHVAQRYPWTFFTPWVLS